MRGGTRSNRRIFPASVHSLLSNYPNTIRNALEKMTPNERHANYIATFENPPMDERRLANIKIYKDIYSEEYPDEFAKAEKAAQRAAATRIVAEELASEAHRLTEYDLSAPTEYHSVLNTLLFGLPNTADDDNDEIRPASVGGKTRRNRRRRNRRSLKRKHSRRR